MKKILLLILIPFLAVAQGPPNCVPTTIVINLDQYQSETSWTIEDTSGNILANGGNYGSQPDYASVLEQRCLPIGPMVFTIYDSYGDGLNGALWGGLDGSYYLLQCNDTLIFGDDPAFGNDSIHVFVSDACPPILGCMDPMYVEFNPLADTDDGSCTTLRVFGCIDSTMYNYDSTANTMALIPSCEFVLTLYDLIGDGWVGSYLEVKQDTNIQQFYLDTTAYTKDFYITLNAPQKVEFRFYVSAQAQLTTPHCGFKLTNPLGSTIIEVLPPFIQPMYKYKTPTYCGNLCVEKTLGCMDSLAVNYIDTVNTDDGSCYYQPGCTNSAYLEYYTQGFTADFNDGSCIIPAVWGCTDSTAFNFDTSANVDNGGCIPVIVGCMQPLAFNYNAQANTSGPCIAVILGCTSPIAYNYNPAANTDDGSCIAVVYGCTDPTAFNYNSAANTNDGSCVEVVLGCTDPTMFNYSASANTDNGSCIPFVYGCMDTSAFNYDPLVNTDNGTCIPILYGCTNPIALNYCDTCNTDDFSCILPIYGCTDSTMFNYNPLANVDNNTCVPFIYGCTDPSMLNYNPQANTEDFSCIAYVYGCMDSTALNYDTLANTDNGSCIEAIAGCRDPNAFNYNPLANIISHDSLGCLYAANCSATEPGDPFFLNDPCYAWLIEVDEYCCNNTWDSICQLTYDYCEGTYAGPLLPRQTETKKLIMITDLLGRKTKKTNNGPLLYIYDNGTIEKKFKQY
tara:strand:- start:914 stop:3112 length:2199 start_codon:yes stop_codon:yes gene_type:complete